ncbi:hypothetical protein PUN28_005048 [Cardiocondyla obscurior]
MLTSQTELKVIQRYAENGKLLTLGYLIMAIITAIAFIILQFLPSIFDVIVPINESRSRPIIITVEYFVDEETYFFPILTHVIISQFAGTMMIIAIGTILTSCVLHASAMFKIASYRIEHIFDANGQLIPKDLKQYIFYNNLTHAIYAHRRAVDLANFMTKSFATLYVLLLGFGVAAISLCVFNCINAVTSLNVTESLMFGGVLTLSLYYVSIANYAGQTIIDSSTAIRLATYNSEWYTASLRLQKLILFVIQRSNKQSALVCGSVFCASCEGFATIMSMAISYVMVLQSMGAHKENYV